MKLYIQTIGEDEREPIQYKENGLGGFVIRTLYWRRREGASQHKANRLEEFVSRTFYRRNNRKAVSTHQVDKKSLNYAHTIGDDERGR